MSLGIASEVRRGILAPFDRTLHVRLGTGRPADKPRDFKTQSPGFAAIVCNLLTAEFSLTVSRDHEPKVTRPAAGPGRGRAGPDPGPPGPAAVSAATVSDLTRARLGVLILGIRTETLSDADSRRRLGPGPGPGPGPDSESLHARAQSPGHRHGGPSRMQRGRTSKLTGSRPCTVTRTSPSRSTVPARGHWQLRPLGPGVGRGAGGRARGGAAARGRASLRSARLQAAGALSGASRATSRGGAAARWWTTCGTSPAARTSHSALRSVTAGFSEVASESCSTRSRTGTGCRLPLVPARGGPRGAGPPSGC